MLSINVGIDGLAIKYEFGIKQWVVVIAVKAIWQGCCGWNGSFFKVNIQWAPEMLEPLDVSHWIL